MIGILLCAGYATRLYPLTKDFPKPLLHVAGKPMIEHIIGKMEEVSVLTKIFIITNTKFFGHFEEWKKTYHGKIPVTILNDSTMSDADKLGPVGDLAFTIDHGKIDEGVLIIAGDNLFEFSLLDMYHFYQKKQSPVVGFYDLKEKSKLAHTFGVGVIAKDGRLMDFEEKPAQPKSSFAATCCYLFPKKDLAVIKNLAREKGAKANAGDIIPVLMRQGPVYGFTFSERWFDIGSKEQLEEARRIYVKQK